MISARCKPIFASKGSTHRHPAGLSIVYQPKFAGARVSFVICRRELEEGNEEGSECALRLFNSSTSTYITCPRQSEEETEQSINDAVSLFRFVQDKDVFERHYKQHLAKRLLMAKSASDDMERLVIGKLKVAMRCGPMFHRRRRRLHVIPPLSQNECGFQFTTKMEGMFNDMRVSADATADFKEQLLKSEVRIAVTVVQCHSVNLRTAPDCTVRRNFCQRSHQYLLAGVIACFWCDFAA